MSIQVDFSGQKLETKQQNNQSLFDALKQISTCESNSFFHAYSAEKDLDIIKAAYQKFSYKKVFVHIGIGGSSLGPEMLISALKKRSNQTEFVFLNNIDPDDIAFKLKPLEARNLDDLLFSFVSKSGSTIETIAQLSLISNWLKAKGVTQDRLKDFFIFTTDPKKSDLLELGKKLDITTLPIPSEIGGRFSVLTAVGLFPALFADIDITNLLDGASKIKELILQSPPENNKLIQMVDTLGQLQERGFTQTVIMPYSSRLKDFAFWFTQLWAESLGKKLDLEGNTVNLGLTPIPAYGATDQHSQVQLFVEGPLDKCAIFIEIGNFENDYQLKSELPLEKLKLLEETSLAQLLTAELKGTQKAFEEASRPYFTLKIDLLDEASLGSLILWFETLTALMGSQLKINPFDQPGVEAGKRFAIDWLRSAH